jgi:hypothetical protein
MKLTTVRPTVFESFDDPDDLSTQDQHIDRKQLLKMLSKKIDAKMHEQTQVHLDINDLVGKIPGQVMAVDYPGGDRALLTALEAEKIVRVFWSFVVPNIPKNQPAIAQINAYAERYGVLERDMTRLLMRRSVLQKSMPTS